MDVVVLGFDAGCHVAGWEGGREERGCGKIRIVRTGVPH